MKPKPDLPTCLQTIEDGRQVKLVGSQFGQHFQMLHPASVENLQSVDVRKDAVDTALAINLR